jgi:hypothetical protein
MFASNMRCCRSRSRLAHSDTDTQVCAARCSGSFVPMNAAPNRASKPLLTYVPRAGVPHGLCNALLCCQTEQALLCPS